MTLETARVLEEAGIIVLQVHSNVWSVVDAPMCKELCARLRVELAQGATGLTGNCYAMRPRSQRSVSVGLVVQRTERVSEILDHYYAAQLEPRWKCGRHAFANVKTLGWMGRTQTQVERERGSRLFQVGGLNLCVWDDWVAEVEGTANRLAETARRVIRAAGSDAELFVQPASQRVWADEIGGFMQRRIFKVVATEARKVSSALARFFGSSPAESRLATSGMLLSRWCTTMCGGVVCCVRPVRRSGSWCAAGLRA